MEKVVCSLLAHSAARRAVAGKGGGVQGFLFCTDTKGDLYQAAMARSKVCGYRQRKKWVVDWGVLRALIRLIRVEKIECMHAHNHVAHLYAVLASLCTGVPVIVTLHGQGFHDTRRTIKIRRCLAALTRAVVVVSRDAGDIAIQSGAVQPSKVVVIPNGVDTRRFEPRDALDGRQQELCGNAQASVRADIVAGDHRGKMITLRGVPSATECSSAPGGSLARIREDLGISGDAVVIGSVGRLSPEKNYPLVVRAFSRLVRPTTNDLQPETTGLGAVPPWETSCATLRGYCSDRPCPKVDRNAVITKSASFGRHVKVFLLLVGDGPDRGRIEETIQKLGVANLCHISGIVGDVRPWLHAMDVFCLPSDTEGMSISLLEAGACGLPAVVTDVGGNREIVVDGESGWLVKKGDENALVSALERLRDESDLRNQMAALARLRVEQRFSLDAMAEKYVALYSQVLRGSSRGRLLI